MTIRLFPMYDDYEDECPFVCLGYENLFPSIIYYWQLLEKSKESVLARATIKFC